MGVLLHDLRHDCYMCVTPLLNNQVMYETDIAFCAKYQDGISTSRELHRAYETCPG